MSRLKKKVFALGTVLVMVLVAVFHMGIVVGAADNEPGSVGDPLVSKSYLDSRLNDVNGVMTKVTVSKGSVIKVSEGATVILFSGNGNVSGNGAGLINVTAGELTGNGMSMAKYNTYLVPDNTTTITASSTMVVFVTGTYNVTN